MSKRYRVVQAKDIPGRDKPMWLRIGTAFEKEGKMRIKLDVSPLPNKDSEVWLSLFEDDGAGAGAAVAAGGSPPLFPVSSPKPPSPIGSGVGSSLAVKSTRDVFCRVGVSDIIPFI